MNDATYNKRKNLFKIAAWVLGGVLLALLFALVFGYFVMLLWNWLMPVVFGLPEITYLQAAGIIVLSRLIFGGFGHHNHDKQRKYKKFKDKFNCDDDFYSDAEDWKHYHEYWKDEGEEAFKEYLKRKQEERNN